LSAPNLLGETTAVAVKIKLKRMGKIREPYYRIIVADARTKRDGRAIEEIGKYHPKADPSFIEVNSDRAQHWLSVGAQPTDPVRKILEVTGDWQKFKGLPGAEGTLKTAAARSDKKEIFAAVLAETLADSAAAAASKGKARSGGAKAGDAKAGDAKAAADKPAKSAKAAAEGVAAAESAAAPTAEEPAADTPAAAEKPAKAKPAKAADAAEPAGESAAAAGEAAAEESAEAGNEG
jgi:small subunit ribosomal protein S16